MSLNKLSKQCHEQAKKSKFHENNKILLDLFLGTEETPFVLNLKNHIKSMRICQLLYLAESELKEAMEADRKDNYCQVKTELWIEGKEYGFKQFYKSEIKDTFEDEIAGALIRIFDLCGYLNIDIDSHVKAAMHYNSTRRIKHGERY